MDPVELLREHLAFAIDFNVAPPGSKSTAEWAARKHMAIATYRTLSQAQAVAIGRILIASYDACRQRERDETLRTYLTTIPVEELFYIAVFQTMAS